MPKPKGNTIPHLHVGKLVETERRNQRVTIAVLSRRMRRNQSGMNGILKRSSMQAYLVWELSVALGHNFFTELAQQLNAATHGKLTEEQTELEVLKSKYRELEQERDYLRKALDILTDKKD